MLHQSSRKQPVCLTKLPNCRNVRRIFSVCRTVCPTKNLSRKMLRQCFLVSWSSINEDCTRNLHISCIFSIKFAVFTVYGKTSIQTKQCPVSFVRQFSILSDKKFQFVGLLSGNFSHDFAKLVHTKFCGNWSTGLGKKHFLRVFTIYICMAAILVM